MDLGGLTNSLYTPLTGIGKQDSDSILPSLNPTELVFGSSDKQGESNPLEGNIFSGGILGGGLIDTFNPIKISKKLPGGNSPILNPVGTLASKLGNFLSKIPLVGGILGNLLGADEVQEKEQ